MVNNKGPGGGEKESGNGLVHTMQHTSPQAKSVMVRPMVLGNLGVIELADKQW
jgi:hypothetical protein